MKQSRSDYLSELMWSIIADAFKYSNESPDISPNRSLKDYFVEEVSKRDLNQNDTRIVLQMAEIWGGFIGDHVEHQSLRYFWLEECIDGGMLAAEFVTDRRPNDMQRTSFYLVPTRLFLLESQTAHSKRPPSICPNPCYL